MAEEAKRGPGRPKGSLKALTGPEALGLEYVLSGANTTAAAREALTQAAHAGGSEDFAARLAAAAAARMAEEFKQAVPLDDGAPHFGPWWPQEPPEDDGADDGCSYLSASSLFASAKGRKALRDAGIEPRAVRAGPATLDTEVNALTKRFDGYKAARHAEDVEAVARIAAEYEAHQKGEKDD